MSTATRLLRNNFKPSTNVLSSSSSAKTKTVRCLGNNAGFNSSETRSASAGTGTGTGSGDHRKSAVVPIKASVATSHSLMITAEPKVGRGSIHTLASLLLNLTRAALNLLRPAVKVKPTSSNLHIQRFIERVIIDCRFFSFFAVAGSLLGSILCFLEGCFLLLESYFKFFNTLSQKPDQAHVMHLLIEAIDMFLVGTAMFTFGVGLYAMFVGSRERSAQLPGSNLFGLFYLKTLPKWAQMGSVSQAKSKIGHALMMVLQVGVLEKFNNVPLVTSLDLVCFAGAVLLSSACIFLLARLSVASTASRSLDSITRTSNIFHQ